MPLTFQQYESQSTKAASPAKAAAAEPAAAAEKEGGVATAAPSYALDEAALSAMVAKQKDLVKRSREAIAATKRLTLKKEFSQNILKRWGMRSLMFILGMVYMGQGDDCKILGYCGLFICIPVGQHQIFNVIPRSKLLEMSEAGQEGGSSSNGGGGGNNKISRHVELLERKIAKLARRERRAAANRELGEKILLEKLRMAEEGEEDGIRYALSCSPLSDTVHLSP